MRLVIRLVVVVVALAGAGWLWGRSLPREHEATSTLTLVAPVDSVWAVVRDIRGTPQWWGDMKGAKRVAGAPRETWDEDMGSAGTMRVEITRAEPGRRLVMTILDPDGTQGWGGVWTLTLRADGSATEVSLTETGWVDPPLFRVVTKVRGAHATLDSYLRALGGRFGELASPRHG